MGRHVGSLRLGTVGHRDVDAERVAAKTFYNFLQLEVLNRKNAKVAIVAGRHEPVLLALLAHPESSDVVDPTHIEPQDHVRVQLLRNVLEEAHNVVECSMGVDLAGQRDAVYQLFKLLRYNTYLGLTLSLRIDWEGQV